MRMISAIAVISAFLGVGAPAARAGDVGCGAILGPGGHFALDADIGPCAGGGAAITLLDRARLYLRGFTVSCEASPTGFGRVGVLVSGNGAYVYNGTITGCDTGVKVEGDGNRIALVRTQQTPLAVTATGDRNVVTRNTADGAFEVSGEANTVYGNVSEGPGSGVTVSGEANRIVGNSVRSGGTGFLLWGPRILVILNGASFNDCVGLEVAGEHVTVRRNNAYRNGCDGLRLTVDDSDVRGNSADGNFVGIRVGGDGNRILGNSARNNEDFDFIDSWADCTHNTWRHNIYNPDPWEQRRSPICIE